MSSYITPSDEQLANFAAVLIFGPGASNSEREMILRKLSESEEFRRIWLTRHLEYQEKLSEYEA